MKMTIFKHIRHPNHYDKIIGKQVLRVLNVDPTFVGVTAKGEVNLPEFRKLADELEPYCDGINVT